MLRGQVTTVLVLAALSGVASAAPTFYTDRASFLADPRVTGTTTVNFDGEVIGTDLNGQSRSGATFSAPTGGATPLSVILGATGVRNPMSPSSGANLLSPGGSSAAAENDDLRINFATPRSAAGMDVVFDVPDGLSFVGVTFFDANGGVLGSNGFIPSPSGAPGYQFVGLVTDGADIASILFDEFDPTANDDNVGYDTLTFSSARVITPPPPGGQVAEPGPLALLGLGLAAMGLLRRRERA